MSDRFDLEQQILDCWRVTSDLDALFEDVMENPDIDNDKIANILLGLSQLYEIKFNKTFRTFEQLIASRSFYGTPVAAQADPNFPGVDPEVLAKAKEYVNGLGLYGDEELPPATTTKAKKKAKK